MEEDIEMAEIPSDSESVDGVCGSDLEDDDEFIGSDRNVGPQDDSDSENSNESDDAEEEDDDDTWIMKGRTKDDVPFTEIYGPNIPENIVTPLDIFLCLYPNSLLDQIVQQTNLYSQQQKTKNEPVTKKELLIFIAINILMGVKKLPSYRDHWSKDEKLNDQYISSLMTVNRFGFLLSHLHITDNSQEPKKGDKNYDKLYKLRPLLTKLTETFKNCWKPSDNQSIDESMIKFKGRSSMKQYMPAKPVKRGYKSWTRADESRFICEFQIYTGKAESTEKQLGARVVKDLTRELVGKNHHVFFDNFFTGVNLLKELRIDKVFACGTVRQNRKGLPRSNIPDKKMDHGQFEYRTCNAGISWIKWMDKKAVFFLSNYHDPCEVTTTSRRQKDGSLKSIQCPVMCSDYHKHMGYVDRADHLISTYKIDRKSKKWWHRIFWHLLDLTIINAFILYNKKQLQASLTSKEFRLLLVDQLVSDRLPTRRGRKRQDISPHKVPSKPQVPIEKRRAQSAHMPICSQNPRRCTHCSTKDTPVRTLYTCSTCNVPLCIKFEKNCFSAYHS